MNFEYQIIEEKDVYCIKDLFYELMSLQKSKADKQYKKYLENMTFENRMISSIEKAKNNQIVIVKDNEEIIGYVYSNISSKNIYSNDFATFFDIDSIKKEDVGCLSQFYISDKYRGSGVGSKLFKMSMEWLNSFKEVEDLFIFVSNGNNDALKFYEKKSFKISHNILDGFITVLRN